VSYLAGSRALESRQFPPAPSRNAESPSDDPVVTCSCIYGNELGDWVGCIADEDSVNGNICEDPLFCDIAGEDFMVEDCSPCLGVCVTGIGAYESGCACGAATMPTTWGGIKAEFGRDEAGPKSL
jgi:hypothetical protein